MNVSGVIKILMKSQGDLSFSYLIEERFLIKVLEEDFEIFIYSFKLLKYKFGIANQIMKNGSIN